MAGTTNMQQFNPAQSNQETDAQYAADANRSGGFATDAIWPSTLANKSLNLLSNYWYAFATALASKGYTTSDANMPTLEATFANVLTETDILPNMASIPYSPSIVLNTSAANGFFISPLTGNATITGFSGSGFAALPLVTLAYQQDGVGGRTIGFGGQIVGGITPDPTPNSVSIQLFHWVSGILTGGDSTILLAAGPLISSTGRMYGGELATTQTPTASTTASDHSVPIVLNGTTYYMRLSSTP